MSLRRGRTRDGRLVCRKKKKGSTREGRGGNNSHHLCRKKKGKLNLFHVYPQIKKKKKFSSVLELREGKRGLLFPLLLPERQKKSLRMRGKGSLAALGSPGRDDDLGGAEERPFHSSKKRELRICRGCRRREKKKRERELIAPGLPGKE